MTAGPRIAVVGAGIVGAAIAWHLTARGAQVTVLDAGARGGVATPHSWAWINASWGNPEAYVRLRLQAMADWRRLGYELPGLPVEWPGGLLWDLPPGELEAYVRQHGGWGYDLRLVGRDEIRSIEPALADPPAVAAFAPGEGAVDPLAAALLLLQAAEARGAAIVPDRRVTAVEVEGGRIAGIRTAEGRLAADRVVVAAGAGTPALCASLGLGLPVAPSPGLLVSTRPLPRLLKGLVMAPEVHVRQLADGRLLAGADYGGADPGDDAGAQAAGVVACLRRLLGERAKIALEGWSIGQRPMPGDDLPIVGACAALPGLAVAAMHSGVTLAPVIGRLLAAEILDGERAPLLAPFRPERFAG